MKTKPKGYDADHEYIELLKLKSFTVSEKFKDSELSSITAIEKVVKSMKQIYPLTIFLKQAIATI